MLPKSHEVRQTEALESIAKSLKSINNLLELIANKK